MKNFLKHLFIPHVGNDFKPHIFREIGVLIILFFVLVLFFGSFIFPKFLSKNNFLAAIYSAAIVNLTNIDREDENLNLLVVDEKLTLAAQNKAYDMATKGYFAHNSPDGLTPWFWIKQVNYDFVNAGENLAVDFNDSEDVEEAWMKSPLHRANILNGHFTDIGIGIASGFFNGKETIFVVQMFGSKKDVADVKSEAQVNVEPIPVIVPEKVLGASTTEEKLVEDVEIISSGGNFVAVTDKDGELYEAKEFSIGAVASAPKISWYENILVNPSKTVRIIYLFLIAIILVSLIIFVLVEFKTKHTKHLIYGLLLLAVIVTLLYINRFLFIGKVLVV